MRVAVWETNEDLEGEMVGYLVLRDGRVVAEPADHPTLRYILENPAVLYDGTEVRADEDPKQFLENLFRTYWGLMLRCGKAVE